MLPKITPLRSLFSLPSLLLLAFPSNSPQFPARLPTRATVARFSMSKNSSPTLAGRNKTIRGRPSQFPIENQKVGNSQNPFRINQFKVSNRKLSGFARRSQSPGPSATRIGSSAIRIRAKSRRFLGGTRAITCLCFYIRVHPCSYVVTKSQADNPAQFIIGPHLIRIFPNPRQISTLNFPDRREATEIATDPPTFLFSPWRLAHAIL
jgi:hypothetical protein